MARIAAHHKKGHPLAKETDYVLKQEWPDDCMVQWGGRGVVLGKNPYSTAFFEAFPKGNAGGFIRGEGQTIEEAEAKAFAAYQRENACQHVWGRRKYTSGAGLCVKCGAFKSSIFEPVVEIGAWKKPITSDELSSISYGFIRENLWSSHNDEPGHIKWRKRLALRAHQAGIKLPPTPEPQKEPVFDGKDEYQAACYNACLHFYLEQRTRFLDEAGNSSESAAAFFRAFENAGFDSEARRRGLLPPKETKEFA